MYFYTFEKNLKEVMQKGEKREKGERKKEKKRKKTEIHLPKNMDNSHKSKCLPKLFKKE